jgi:hypothetical protein
MMPLYSADRLFSSKETKTNTVKKNTRQNIESKFFGKFNFDKDKKVLTTLDIFYSLSYESQH